MKNHFEYTPESFCCTPETNNTVNQIYFKKKEYRLWNQAVWVHSLSLPFVNSVTLGY